MEPGSTGQNGTQAVQDGFDRGLIGHGAGRVQQNSISIFGGRHDRGTIVCSMVYKRSPRELIKLLHFLSVIRVTACATV
jgi:hypothetical protein